MGTHLASEQQYFIRAEYILVTTGNIVLYFKPTLVGKESSNEKSIHWVGKYKFPKILNREESNKYFMATKNYFENKGNGKWRIRRKKVIKNVLTIS